MEKIIEKATIFYKSGSRTFHDAISISESGVYAGEINRKNETAEYFVSHTFIPRSQIQKIIILDKQGKSIDIDL